MNKQFNVRILVRMGSNRFCFKVKRVHLESDELVKMALVKSGLGSKTLEQSKTYAVFESLSGSERRLHRHENIIDLVADSSHRHRVKPVFIIRKLAYSTKQRVKPDVATVSIVESRIPERKLVDKHNPLDIIKSAYSRFMASRRMDNSFQSRAKLISPDDTNSCGNSDDEETDVSFRSDSIHKNLISL